MAEYYGQIDGQYKIEYQQNVKLALQQMDSRFENAVSTMPDLKGVATQIVDLVGTSETIDDGPDDTPTPDIPPSNEGIYVTPRHSTWGRLIRNRDTIMTATDYQSPYVQEMAAAFKRRKDRLISAAFFGPRLIGFDDGTGSYVPGSYAAQAYAGPVIAVDDGYFGPPGTAATPGTPKNMNPIKILDGMAQLIAGEIAVELEDTFVGMTYKQHRMMYDGIQATSTDYTGRDNVTFQKKRMMSFMENNIIIFNSLPLDGDGYRRCPMWTKSGMWLGEAMGLTTNIDRRPDRQWRVQMFGEAWWAATRSEDARVVEIKCLDTLTAT